MDSGIAPTVKSPVIFRPDVENTWDVKETSTEYAPLYATAAGKASMKITLTVGSTSASSLDDVESAEPEESEAKQDQPELGLSVGAERSAEALGRAEREAIGREGYTIVAVLPEGHRQSHTVRQQ